MGLRLLRADELDTYRVMKKTVLIDLREKQAYRQEHIYGAVNVPYEELEHYVLGIRKGRIREYKL